MLIHERAPELVGDGGRKCGVEREFRRISPVSDLDGLWKYVVEILREGMRYRSCSIVLGLVRPYSAAQASRQDSASIRERDNPDYCLGLAEHFLADRPHVTVYTSAYLLQTDPSSRAALEAWRETGEVAWSHFVHLIFRDGARVDSILSVRRDPSEAEFTAGEIEFLRRLHPVVNGGLQRLREQARTQACDAALLRFFGAIPIPILFLDCDQRLVFASREGYDACAVWNFGARGARVINPRTAYELPDAIARGCRQLATRCLRSDGSVEGVETPNERVEHPENRDMVANIAVSHRGRGLWAKPGFFVTFAIERNLDGAAIPELRSATAHLRLLSPGERRVALLAAEGCGNATIAERLRKSKRTVECQITSIYQKLRVGNRIQLIRLLV